MDDDFWTSIGIDPTTVSDWSNASSPSNNDILWNTGYFDGVTADYSNEGNNYPTAESTQGSGGSPVNASTSGFDLSTLAKALFTNKDGSINTGVLGAVLGGVGGALGLGQVQRQPTGYQGGIPKYRAVRQAPAQGQKLSGNVTYEPVAKAEGGELEPGGFIIPADVVSGAGNGSSDAGLKILAARLGATPIKGDGDGMSDSIDTTIGGTERAKVAHEEAYVSPERVAEIGGGDPKKGAQKLRNMMDRIRKARTGTTEQGKQIDPHKFMPGGEVRGYADGGPTGSAIDAGLSGTESSLSNWAGPYVTDMLAKGQALSEMPFEQYSGPLTAGPSALQTQAFNTAAGLQTPASIGQAASTAGGLADAFRGAAYNPVGSDFTADYAQQYMNPFLKAALDPQMAELKRQADIKRIDDATRLTKAGAYGGGRQAIMESEGARNLLDMQRKALGEGYATAYDKAMAQFNADQARKVQESQFGSEFGLKGLQNALGAAQAQGQLGATEQKAGLENLQALTGLGATQRDIEQQGIAADKAAFEEARINPYKMVQFQQSLLSGLPLAAQSYNIAPPSTLQQILAGLGGGAKLGKITQADINTALKNLGVNVG